MTNSKLLSLLDKLPYKGISVTCPHIHIYTTYRWLGFWLDSLGAFIVFFAALFAVAERDTITGGLAGVALTYAMQVSIEKALKKGELVDNFFG